MPMSSIKLQVDEAQSDDVGRGIARLSPEALETLNLEVGDFIAISSDNDNHALAKAMISTPSQRGNGIIQIDGLLRKNAGAAIGSIVNVSPVSAKRAKQLTLQPLNLSANPQSRDSSYVKELLLDLPVRKGNSIRANLFGSGFQNFKVLDTSPEGDVIIDNETTITINEPQDEELTTERGLSYEDIGGLDKELQRVREMIELPLSFPQLFNQLGITPPKGVLLHGAPGTGKTLIARAVSNECQVEFYNVNGPEVMDKFYGESEAKLRRIFKTAQKSAPSIIFIDEIDAICPKRENTRGDVEKRVVSQLLALMDGLKQREQVIVIGATNIPDVLDPALRRGGRFDREISIPIPAETDREEILKIHTRGMPLDEDVNIDQLAEMTHGFVGADIEALAREAAMSTLRRALPDLDLESGSIPYDKVLNLKVNKQDFEAAFTEVEPSATREVFVETPSVTWDQIGGLQQAKQKLRQAVEWPLRHSEAFEYLDINPPRGILLHGPPGTGKTLLAKALANESEVNFISIRGPELLSKYVGESEKQVRDIFQKARQAAPCIIFFDEIEALVAERGGGIDNNATERVTSQILNELDGLQSLQGVIVLGATNRKDLLDEALLRPGRLELHLSIENPDLVERKEIFQVHTRNLPLADDLDYEELALDTEGLNGSEIEYICRQTAMSKIEEYVSTSSDKTLEDLKITQQDFKPDIENAKQDSS